MNKRHIKKIVTCILVKNRSELNFNNKKRDLHLGLQLGSVSLTKVQTGQNVAVFLVLFQLV